jgi:hypothetical protein
MGHARTQQRSNDAIGIRCAQTFLGNDSNSYEYFSQTLMLKNKWPILLVKESSAP